VAIHQHTPQTLGEFLQWRMDEVGGRNPSETTEIEDRSYIPGATTDGLEKSELASRDKDPGQNDADVPEQTVTSRPPPPQVIKGCIFFGLQVLTVHRLGVLATEHLYETQNFGDKVIGLVVMLVVIFLVLLSFVQVEVGRRSAQVGRQTNVGERLEMVKFSDPVVSFVFLSLLSLLVPLVRLLFA
jgi:hypothetical protein